MKHTMLEGKTALVTGGVRRIGAAIARTLHEAGMDLALHYRSSADAAAVLRDELEARRPGSVTLIRADLLDTAQLPMLVERVIEARGRLDLLVNNASSFYPTPVGSVTEVQWDDLLGSNLKAPFFLCQAAAAELRQRRGCIVNLVDIHAQRPMSGHAVYCIAKAGLAMLTRSLAWDLGPEIRVNGLAPGAILWPEKDTTVGHRDDILSRTALKVEGQPDDIARGVLFLARDAGYVTGQILAIDGGRSLSM